MTKGAAFGAQLSDRSKLTWARALNRTIAWQWSQRNAPPRLISLSAKLAAWAAGRTVETCCRNHPFLFATMRGSSTKFDTVCMRASVRMCAWALASTAFRPGQLLCGHAASQAGETNAGSLIGADSDPGPSQPASARQKHTQRGGTQSQRAPKRHKYFPGDDEETVAKENLVRPTRQEQGIARTSALCIEAPGIALPRGCWCVAAECQRPEAGRRPRS